MVIGSPLALRSHADRMESICIINEAVMRKTDQREWVSKIENCFSLLSNRIRSNYVSSVVFFMQFFAWPIFRLQIWISSSKTG